jgi:hypothetical protein
MQIQPDNIYALGIETWSCNICSSEAELHDGVLCCIEKRSYISWFFMHYWECEEALCFFYFVCRVPDYRRLDSWAQKAPCFRGPCCMLAFPKTHHAKGFFGKPNLAPAWLNAQVGLDWAWNPPKFGRDSNTQLPYPFPAINKLVRKTESELRMNPVEGAQVHRNHKLKA